MSSKLSSLFRSKSEAPSPRRGSRPFSRILSPARSKQNTGSTPPNEPPASTHVECSVTRLPLDPHSSPVSNGDANFDAQRATYNFDGPLPSREGEDPDERSSLVNGYHDIHSDQYDRMDEREMERKLMDLESSFLPDIPPKNEKPVPRAFRRSQNSPLGETFRRANRSVEDTTARGSWSSEQRSISATPSESYKTPATALHRRVDTVPEVDETHVEEEVDRSSVSVHHSLSSPSAAAAQRSRLRAAAAGFSPLRNATTLALVSPKSSQHRETSSRLDSTPLKSSQVSDSLTHVDPPSDPTSTSQDLDSQERDATGNASEELDGRHTSQTSSEHRTSLEPPKSSAGKRPSYLKTRQSSQRSSSSSFLSADLASELAGADSEGDTPGSISTIRPDRELSRLPSLGSVASTMSINTQRSTNNQLKRTASGVRNSTQEKNLTPVAEGRSKTASPPETPQVTINSVSEPRQTVVAQHVRDVEVPTTVARRYKSGLPTESVPKSSNFTSPNFGRNKGELTLKEQNSRIDKLSKENFDLKLKIHYLYQALQDRSDEGVKDLISKNAQLSTDIIKVRKENQSLRKREREVERELRSKDDGLSAARTVSESEDVISSRSWQQTQLEDEISYLRDRMQAVEEDNVRLRQAENKREPDKRRMVDQAKSMNNSEQATLLRVELEQEKSRRERADQEAQELRQELSRLRVSRSPIQHMQLHPGNAPGDAQGRPISKSSVTTQEGTSLSGTTIVDQLKQENSDLRRDLGAQTSMLTSRNRERERLQQEIEDLKLLQRRGDGPQSQSLSVSGDSVLDRSVSRNNFRPNSRASASAKTDLLSESEKDKYEAKQAALRDENATLRMRIQDLQTELDDLTGSAEHLENLRKERDDALVLIEEERDFAADAIDRLEEQAEQKEKDIRQLLAELRAKEDESQTLEKEIRDITASMSTVVDESEANYATIQELRQDLSVANGELEAAQFNLHEAVAAKERLEVQAESSQGEISFLREEQEADKIRLSDLQSALTRAKTNLRDEKERLREFEEMEAETKKARDEARHLRRDLSSKEDDLVFYREGVAELEDGLRDALDSTEQNRSVLLELAGRLRRQLDEARAELEQVRGGLEQKHQRLQDHIMLLDSCEAERQRLSNALEKEKQARQQDQREFDRAQSSPTGTHRVPELEGAYVDEQQRSAVREDNDKSQLQQRTKLLFDLWTRLAALCGSEWVENFGTSTSQKTPTFESTLDDPNSTNAAISTALDTISQTLSTFRTRIRSTEKDMYKDLEALSNDLDIRSKRIDVLERSLARQDAAPQDTSAPAPADLNRLKDENRLLRRELKILKQGAFALPGLQSPQHELDTAAQEAKLVEHERDRLNTASPTSHRSRRHGGRPFEDEPSALQRHKSSMAHTANDTTESDSIGPTNAPASNGDAPSLAPSEQLWVMRLKELERRLKAEREGRLIDRSGARKKLEERDNQIGGLRRELEMEKERKAMIRERLGVDSSGA